MSRTGRADARVTFGIVGYRNYKLPLFMSQTINANPNFTTAASSLVDMSDNQTRWQLSVRAQKTIKRMSRGPTLGLVGDVFIPITSAFAAPGAPDVPVLPSKALRVGVVLAF